MFLALLSSFLPNFLSIVDDFAYIKLHTSLSGSYASTASSSSKPSSRAITATTPEPYLLLKQALLSRFTSSPFQQCFLMLDMPNLGDSQPSAMIAKMQVLLPPDSNVFFNMIFLHRLPEAIRNALIDHGESELREMSVAADLLLHTMPAVVVAGGLIVFQQPM
jgi:hypothetical protein